MYQQLLSKHSLNSVFASVQGWIGEERYRAGRAGEGKSPPATATSASEAFSPHSATQVARL
ncbi:hypothetical protein [Fischerella sp. PCC 9605]|uniref:hypothetical protein n=1 Tax=Fischerella sp. PCC 9605 TaxID=1173024 RepID=UPI0004B26892|nr:hypothetical protein [Fischerella sp. PCC 9605]